MISKFIQKDLFLLDKKFASKNEALLFFSNLLEEKKYVKNSQETYNLALAREKEFPTNIGNKIAMPHILNDVVLKPCILFARVDDLTWDENDMSENKNINYIFFIIFNKDTGASSHMDIISELSRTAFNDDFIQNLNSLSSFKEFKSLFKEEKEITSFEDEKKNNEIYDIVAVTACPTGVAHTYLAAEALIKEAKNLGLNIKVETQGTEGGKNILSQEEINKAKGIILALDRSVDTSRFAGQENVLEISTRTAMKDSKNVLEKSLRKEGVTFKGSVNKNSSSDDNLISFNNFGKRIYRSLMNGVGHMLPFVIFGGIMIAIAFMIDTFAGVPESEIGNLGSYHNASKWFKQIGDISFTLLVPILGAYMAFGLVGKGGLLPGFITGFMSTGIMYVTIRNDIKVPWLMDFLSDEHLKMLANGSGFFGAIGGALLTAALYILITKYIFAKMPNSLNAIKNILLMPFFGTLIIAGAFFILNIPLQFVNLGFGMLLNLFKDWPQLYPILGLIMGMMMCSDLGGPINKAAYVFGTITIASSGSAGSIPMAIAMGSGMVPPLAIALSGTIDRKIWTKDQIKQSYSNYVMGLSFISEGAIPFTAEQPRKMIISNLIGGAITGILIGSLQVGSLAPHGGIFVVPLLRCQLFQNAGMQIGMGITFFLGSVLIGSFAEMGVISILSRFTKFGKNKQLEEQIVEYI
ncbi:MAG: PTS fructose transporter subunit IIABC [Metamycoplasmataceae bacterium]